MNDNQIISQNRRIILNWLSVVGFIALVGAAMWLAAYSTRYVPTVVNRIGAAAVYLGSVFVPAPESNLTVVPTASTTIPFGTASSTTPAKVTPSVTKPVTPTAGAKTTGTYPLGSTTPATLFGYPDLVVHINAVGYLATTSADSFVASTTIPAGKAPAVSFTIKNTGTNRSGSWRWNASLPTSSSSLYQSDLQQNLNPGDYIDYTFGFSGAVISGTDRTISITVNPDNLIIESNTTNDVASAKVTILGS
jgi:hypothetical protein